MTRAVLGILGGSGLYELPALSKGRWEPIASPWGEPSDCVLMAEVDGLQLAFLPRHGRGHRLSPGDINYRANIDVLKRVGATSIISLSACGSFREELKPGLFVLVDQFVDRTVARQSSFFGPGCVAHVSMARPVSPGLVDGLERACQTTGVRHRRGGTYLAIEGPHFSTAAESRLYRSWGCDVIGMTNMPEAKLAREAEICYATVAMVTDYDSWHGGHGDVDIANILRVMNDNSVNAQRMMAEVIRSFPREHEPCPVGSDRALEGAIITASGARDPSLLAKLDAVARRVLS